MAGHRLGMGSDDNGGSHFNTPMAQVDGDGQEGPRIMHLAITSNG